MSSIILSVLLLASSQLIFANDCNDVLDEKSKEIAIAFFPDSSMGHVRIEADGRLWEVHTGLGKRERNGVQALERSNKPSMRFTIPVTEAEYEQVLDYIKNNPKTNSSCMGGTCALVSEVTGMWFPPIIRNLPGLNLSYTALESLLNKNSRISKIEMYNSGKSPIYQTFALSFHSIKEVAFFTMGPSVYAMIFYNLL